jgi:hypothetical protein
VADITDLASGRGRHVGIAPSKNAVDGKGIVAIGLSNKKQNLILR